MGSLPKWLQGTAVLSLIGAVAVVSPAFGGPSLKSLVKKEVAKQVSRAAGPPGPPGAAGVNGANGPQGPGALRLTFSQPESDNQVRALGTVNELTVSALCKTVAGVSTVFVYLRSSVDGATVHGTYELTNNDSLPVATSILADGVFTSAPGYALAVTPDNSGEFKRQFLRATFTTADREISLSWYAVANDAANSCDVHGTATPAS